MKNKAHDTKDSDKKTTPYWSVWRQDDNGNVALVKSGLTQAAAIRLSAEYEAKGHKQTYWAKESNSLKFPLSHDSAKMSA